MSQFPAQLDPSQTFYRFTTQVQTIEIQRHCLGQVYWFLITAFNRSLLVGIGPETYNFFYTLTEIAESLYDDQRPILLEQNFTNQVINGILLPTALRESNIDLSSSIWETLPIIETHTCIYIPRYSQ